MSLNKKIFQNWNCCDTCNDIPRKEREYVIKMLDAIEETTLRNKLSNLITWYIDRAEKSKKWYYILNIIIFFSDGFIPVIAIYKSNDNSAVIASLLASLATFSLALSNLFHFKDNWVRYRTAVENIKNSLSMYLIQKEDCQCKDKNGCFGCDYCNNLWNNCENENKDNVKATYRIFLKCKLTIKLIEEINTVVDITNEKWYDEQTRKDNFKEGTVSQGL